MYSASIQCPHCGAQHAYVFMSIRRGQNFGCKSCGRPVEVTQELVDKAMSEYAGDSGGQASAPGGPSAKT